MYAKQASTSAGFVPVAKEQGGWDSVSPRDRGGHGGETG